MGHGKLGFNWGRGLIGLIGMLIGVRLDLI